jgi:hypothetical protein
MTTTRTFLHRLLFDDSSGEHDKDDLLLVEEGATRG